VYCENESRFVRFGLDLLPQVDDVCVNRAGRGKTVIAPHFLEQTIAAKGFALMTKKIFE
jgi:hypothetical protein